MRSLESVQLLAVVAAVYLPVVLETRLKRGRMAVVLIATMVAQLVLEGFRWQLVPLELASFGLAVGDILWEERRLRGLPRVRRAVLGVVGIGVVVVLPSAFPIPELPPPQGPFTVGTRTLVLEDPERQDPYVEVPEAEEGSPEAMTDPRRLVVQVWYPAEQPEDAEPAPWHPDPELISSALAARIGFPSFLLSHLDGVPSSSYPGAAVLSGRFPVVVYVHGWTGFRSIALNQIEAFASHGYVVVAADHPHAALVTRFPDGEVIPYSPEALPDVEEVGEEARLEAAELLTATVTADLQLILDQLETGPRGPFGALTDHVDLDSVGLVGHSLGGGAAVRLCLVDDRCRSVAGLDAWVEPIPPRVIAEELRVPSLFIRSDGWRGTPNDRLLRGLAERSPSRSYWMGIDGSRHSDFVLAPLFSPIGARLGLNGEVPPELMLDLVETYLLAFFDRTLYGVGGAMLDTQPPPMVSLELVP